MHALELDGISKIFRAKKGAVVQALTGLSLAISPGEVFGFLGPNGAGKSTTIKILMGLILPTAGNAKIMGHATGDPLARKHVGYLPENPAFYDFLTAREYLAFVAKAFAMPADTARERTEEVLNLLDLQEAGNRIIRGYSKGMVQRLGLAQTLIHDPDLYILDEPMSGLDPLGRALVKNIILDLKKKGKCVFFSTHITADVESVCDRVGIIVKGVLQRVERVDEILAYGILGYHVLIKERGSSEAREVYVEKADFPAFIAAAQTRQQEIVTVEPKRKDLEDFFIDIVKGH